jgi:hypothetical protein
LARKRIGVVGLSVGQSVALVLALERSFAQLRVADFDTLDLWYEPLSGSTAPWPVK